MARFRFKLLAGQHIQADRSQKPAVTTDPATGAKTEKFQSRTFKAGETIECDTNLAARFGQEKFELLGGDDSYHHDPYPPSPSVAPGGQVSSGHQINSGGVSGAMTPEQVEHFAAKKEGDSGGESASAPVEPVPSHRPTIAPATPKPHMPATAPGPHKHHGK